MDEVREPPAIRNSPVAKAMVDDMAEPKKTRKRKSSSAPGQYYGYAMVQGARLLHRLLSASEGEVVTIEGLDDIAIESAEGLLVEQDKSGLKHNPVADTSPALWKTLRNWLEGLRSGLLPPGTKFVLYVAQAHTGSVVEKIHQCRSSAEGALLALALRNNFWGEAPDYPVKALNTASLREHLDPVFSASDDVLGTIFSSFELVQGSGSPYEDIKKLLATKAIEADEIDSVHNALIGWCQKKVAKQIESGLVPSVPQEEFHKFLLSVVRKHCRGPKDLIPTRREILDEEVRNHIQSATYIQQMRLVDLDEEHMADAVVDYLRASADRANWGSKGHVMEESFSEYQIDLVKNWRRLRDAVPIELGNRSPTEVGMTVYFRCMQVSMPLQRMAVPEYFTPGTFHSLADACTVGWHPEFKKLVGGKKNNDQEPGAL